MNQLAWVGRTKSKRESRRGRRKIEAGRHQMQETMKRLVACKSCSVCCSIETCFSVRHPFILHILTSKRHTDKTRITRVNEKERMRNWKMASEWENKKSSNDRLYEKKETFFKEILTKKKKKLTSCLRFSSEGERHVGKSSREGLLLLYL